jgi:regulator of sigma D
MDKNIMRDILEVHADNFISEQRRRGVKEKDLEILSYGLIDYFSSKQMEIYEDLFENGLNYKG